MQLRDRIKNSPFWWNLWVNGVQWKCRYTLLCYAKPSCTVLKMPIFFSFIVTIWNGKNACKQVMASKKNLRFIAYFYCFSILFFCFILFCFVATLSFVKTYIIELSRLLLLISVHYIKKFHLTIVNSSPSSTKIFQKSAWKRKKTTTKTTNNTNMINFNSIS